MADPNYAPIGDDANDDLPRTFRREKEARAREARERAAQERATAPPTLSSGSAGASAHYADSAAVSGQIAPGGPATTGHGQADMIDMPYPASVRRFDVPFVHLVGFFLKAVVAAVPAIILLGIMLWFGGQLFESLFPDLLKMKILISFPT